MRNLTAAVLFLALSTLSQAKDTIVVVIDASGSMNEKVKTPKGWVSKIDVAKESLKRVLPNLKGDVDLGIVVFSAGNLSGDQEWVYPVGPVNPNNVISAIDRPIPSKGTPIGDYAKIGADKLLERRAKSGNSGRYRLIIVTDGDNTEGRDPEDALKDIKRKGVEVDLIGLGMDGEHSLAKIVRSLPTPGTYQSAQDTDQLVEAVSNVVKEATTVNSTIDESVFEEIGPLDDKVAGALIGLVSFYNNTPIGDPDPVLKASTDSQGQVSFVAEPTPQDNSIGSYLPFVVVGSGLCFIVIVVLIVIGAKTL